MVKLLKFLEKHSPEKVITRGVFIVGLAVVLAILGLVVTTFVNVFFGNELDTSFGSSLLLGACIYLVYFVIKRKLS